MRESKRAARGQKRAAHRRAPKQQEWSQKAGCLVPNHPAGLPTLCASSAAPPAPAAQAQHAARPPRPPHRQPLAAAAAVRPAPLAAALQAGARRSNERRIVLAIAAAGPGRLRETAARGSRAKWRRAAPHLLEPPSPWPARPASTQAAPPRAPGQPSLQRRPSSAGQGWNRLVKCCAASCSVPSAIDRPIATTKRRNWPSPTFFRGLRPLSAVGGQPACMHCFC